MIKLIKEVKKNNKYSNEFKRKIAQEYLSGRYSYLILAEKNGLKNKGVVKEFVKWYNRNNSTIENPEKEMSKIEESPPENISKEALENKIKELESKLRLSQLKVEGLETMMDIAETELKIDIRKKSGTKQSKK